MKTKAEEIRGLYSLSQENATTRALIEIAAQLAELNENIQIAFQLGDFTFDVPAWRRPLE